MPRSLRLPAALLSVALVGWAASFVLMGGMDSLPSFMWLWISMCAAMMLPALVPAASLAASVGRSETAFVSGYLALWAASGVVAFEAARGLSAAGRWVAVAAVVGAAAYQLSPLKAAFLRRCRSPLGLFFRRRALAAGLEHGAACLGCCWALMLALLALGAGSMLWMAAVAAAIFVEKVTAAGARASVPIALALAGAALWVAL